jgi:hypothetical protein
MLTRQILMILHLPRKATVWKKIRESVTASQSSKIAIADGTVKP